MTSSDCAIIVSVALLHHHSSSLQYRSHSFHLLSFPHCCGDRFNQPDPGSTWSQLNAFLCSTYKNTPKALYFIKCVAADSYFPFCYLPHYCATCVIFDPEQGLTGCVTGRNSPTFVNWTVVLFSFMNIANVWSAGLLFEHGALLVGSTLRVWVGGVLNCLVVQVGDRGIWRRMTGYVSGAALTVILVLSFHQNDLCVCLCVCVCGLPPHLVPPQPATRMQIIMHSDSKRCTHLYAFICV